MSFLLGWTRLWYLYHVWTGKSQLELERLHKKHGAVVRIAPNIIDIDIPDMIQTMFNIKGQWLKVRLPKKNPRNRSGSAK